MARKSDGSRTTLETGSSPAVGDDGAEFDGTSAIAVTTGSGTSGAGANDDRTALGGPIPGHSAPAAPADEDALPAGYVLRNRFEIVALVHSGGMSHVYKAIDNRRDFDGSDQVHVAIKMIRRSVDPHLNARLVLEREAAKAQRLSHPNIIDIYDFDRHNKQFYLVMEWLNGESVQALLRRTRGRPLATDFAWRVIHGIAAGLQHAHSNNVVHADINPSNIFITDTQNIKLLDFGVARYCSAAPDATCAEFIWATRTYASPEVLLGLRPVVQDDIFSLACLAYRLLSGTHPFAGSSSADAEQAGVTPQPIPGLAESDWQTLRRALSYARADRPRTAIAFLPNVTTAIRSDFASPQKARATTRWLLAAPAVVVAVMTGAWWLWQGRSPVEPPVIVDEIPVTTEPKVVAEEMPVTAEPTVAAEDAPPPSEIERLLSLASRAMQEERFITPEGDNARELYRDVLALDSTHPTALGGLRSISEVYLQQAATELRARAPERAAAALTTAAETDPGNPAIAVVDDLLRVQGNRRLDEAEQAAAAGDTDRASELLSEAERYAHIDQNAIGMVRQRIGQRAQEEQFLANLALAEAHVTAGRLTNPPGDNAQALLMELQQEYASDPRLLASTERLAEHLLTRAALATAVGRFGDAAEVLDTVEGLGVLQPEAAAVRMSLERAAERAAEMNIALPEEAAPEGAAADRLLSSDEPEEVSAPEFAASGPASSGPISVPADDAVAASGNKALVAPPGHRYAELSDLAIEKYVAPQFPRSAKRRGQTGMVQLEFSVYTDGSTGAVEILRADPSDVFEASAEDAVKQWRFAPRDDEIRAQVSLRFELEQ